MFDQLLHYFTENNLLSMEQYGFRPGHSTELAAVRLVDEITSKNRVGRYYQRILFFNMYYKEIDIISIFILYDGNYKRSILRTTLYRC